MFAILEVTGERIEVVWGPAEAVLYQARNAYKAMKAASPEKVLVLTEVHANADALISKGEAV